MIQLKTFTDKYVDDTETVELVDTNRQLRYPNSGTSKTDVQWNWY